jgi:hypothetical protein
MHSAAPELFGRDGASLSAGQPVEAERWLAYVNDVRESWAVASITVSRSDLAHRRVALSAPVQEPGPGVRALSRALSGGERGA